MAVFGAGKAKSAKMIEGSQRNQNMYGSRTAHKVTYDASAGVYSTTAVRKWKTRPMSASLRRHKIVGQQATERFRSNVDSKFSISAPLVYRGKTRKRRARRLSQSSEEFSKLQSALAGLLGLKQAGAAGVMRLAAQLEKFGGAMASREDGSGIAQVPAGCCKPCKALQNATDSFTDLCRF